MGKLHQVVALVKSRKERFKTIITQAHQMTQKASLFVGMNRVYKPVIDGGIVKPSENQALQANVPDLISQLREPFIDAFDTVLAQDMGNMSAKADVSVSYGGKSVSLAAVPATYLLFLEKQATDLITFINGLPVLDVTETWNQNSSNPNVYEARPTESHTTAKVQEPLVLIQPTKEHPGKAEIVTKDIVVGVWTTTKVSGAITLDRKRAMLARATKLLEAVKTAREEANRGDVTSTPVAEKIFDFVFGA